MVKSLTGDPQAGLNILRFQVRELAQYLFGCQSAGEEIENVGDADTHAAHAGAPAALLRIDRDSLCQIRHRILLVSIMPDSPDRRCLTSALTGRSERMRASGLVEREVSQPYAHFFPSASRPARARSSGVIATRNSTSASKVRNHGSANAGIFDASSRFTIMIAPRCPSRSVK